MPPAAVEYVKKQPSLEAFSLALVDRPRLPAAVPAACQRDIRDDRRLARPGGVVRQASAVTSILNTLRNLDADQPLGNNPWVALAWCARLLVVA